MRKISPLSNSGKPTALGSVTKAAGRTGSDGRGLDVTDRGRLALNARCGFAAATDGACTGCCASRASTIGAGFAGQERADAAQQPRTRQHRRRRLRAPPQPKVPTTRRSCVAAPHCGAWRTLPSGAAPSRLARLLATPPRARAGRYSIAVPEPSAIRTTRSARRGTRLPRAFPHRSRCRARRPRWPPEAIGSSCEIPCASQRTTDLWTYRSRSCGLAGHGSTRHPLSTPPSPLPGLSASRRGAPGHDAIAIEWCPPRNQPRRRHPRSSSPEGHTAQPPRDSGPAA